MGATQQLTIGKRARERERERERERDGNATINHWKESEREREQAKERAPSARATTTMEVLGIGQLGMRRWSEEAGLDAGL
jgi:hypothetical protein